MMCGFPNKGNNYPMIPLMVQKSGDHQLRLVVYPIIYRVLAPSQVVQDLVTRDLMFHFPTK